ncbi:hypothetical protein NDU88_005854 [Pleurodeles waltl]|uniref:Uncharacterized protein n=1 Tax=Pleurodeles waltl TaxID=8319 RepID=A0AAV7LQ88_PLEWA|nr:hypothetical protein NDU88_005854 [Pleurodeles waltl]
MRPRSRPPFWGQALTKCATLRHDRSALLRLLVLSSPPPPLQGRLQGRLQDPTAGLAISRFNALLMPRPRSRPPSRGQALTSCAFPATPYSGRRCSARPPRRSTGPQFRMPGPRGLRAAGLQRIPKLGPGALL